MVSEPFFYFLAGVPGRRRSGPGSGSVRLQLLHLNLRTGQQVVASFSEPDALFTLDSRLRLAVSAFSIARIALAALFHHLTAIPSQVSALVRFLCSCSAVPAAVAGRGFPVLRAG